MQTPLHEQIFEISIQQLEDLINHFAVSPNLSRVEIDDVETDENGRPARVFFTADYRAQTQVPIVLDAGDDYSKR